MCSTDQKPSLNIFSGTGRLNFRTTRQHTLLHVSLLIPNKGINPRVSFLLNERLEVASFGIDLSQKFVEILYTIYI